MEVKRGISYKYNISEFYNYARQLIFYHDNSIDRSDARLGIIFKNTELFTCLSLYFVDIVEMIEVSFITVSRINILSTIILNIKYLNLIT